MRLMFVMFYRKLDMTTRQILNGKYKYIVQRQWLTGGKIMAGAEALACFSFLPGSGPRIKILKHVSVRAGVPIMAGSGRQLISDKGSIYLILLMFKIYISELYQKLKVIYSNFILTH